MNETPEIKQVSSMGASGTQIGILNNNIGLSPADAVAMAMQIFRDYYPQLKNEVLEEINQTVFEKLRTVPVTQIVSPNPRIVLPAIENASITPEKNIRELYEELLANSMKDSVKAGVHPGFVEIIKQLCPDEAKILRYMKNNVVIPIITLRYENKNGSGIDRVADFSNLGELIRCEYPMKTSEYFDNLCRLGLMNNHGELSSLSDKKLYEPLKNHPYILGQMDKRLYQAAGFERARIQESMINLTSFGKAFCNICIDDVPMVNVEIG